MSRARVLLADDHRGAADALKSLLERDFEVVAVVEDGLALVEAARRLQPDVIVADISMPGLDGIDATRMILGRHPGALVILFTMHQESDVVHRALEAGARGYVYKLRGIDDVIKAIHSVLRGEEFVSSGCLN